MNYKIINDVNNVDKKKWGEFVYNHPHGNIFQTPEMYEVYENTKNYEPVFLAVIDHNENILGTLLAVIQKEYSWFLGNFTARSMIFGRTSDVLRLENGRVLTGPGFTILFKDLPVEAYNIEKNGHNSLLCNIKKQPHYNKEHENLIISTFKKQAGTGVKISIKYVDEFELTKSGKRRYFIAN